MSGLGHDKGLPRPGLLPRRGGWPIVITLGIVIYVGAVYSAQIPRIMPLFVGWCISAVLIACCLYLCWCRWRYVRVDRYVAQHRFRCCTECGYSLHDAPKEGRCPECGSAYEIDAVIRSWQKWLNR